MYKIVGGDSREYGPVEADQLRGWIAQGRANANTLASKDGGPWKPLGTYAEFADVASPPGTAPVAPQIITAPPAALPPGSNKPAVIGLTLAVVSVPCCMCVPLAVVSLVLSIIGLVQIRKTPQNFTTQPIVPTLGIIISIVVIVAAIILNIMFEDQLNEVLERLRRMQ